MHTLCATHTRTHTLTHTYCTHTYTCTHTHTHAYTRSHKEMYSHYTHTHTHTRTHTQGLYNTTLPYDPEGVLGSLTSIVLCLLGVQAGRILTHFRGKHLSIVIRFILWSIVLVSPLPPRNVVLIIFGCTA